MATMCTDCTAIHIPSLDYNWFLPVYRCSEVHWSELLKATVSCSALFKLWYTAVHCSIYGTLQCTAQSMVHCSALLNLWYTAVHCSNYGTLHCTALLCCGIRDHLDGCRQLILAHKPRTGALTSYSCCSQEKAQNWSKRFLLSEGKY